VQPLTFTAEDVAADDPEAPEPSDSLVTWRRSVPVASATVGLRSSFSGRRGLDEWPGRPIKEKTLSPTMARKFDGRDVNQSDSHVSLKDFTRKDFKRASS
jgi:hypothetical protein